MRQFVIACAVILAAGCSSRESADRAWQSFVTDCNRQSFDVRLGSDNPERKYFVASCRVER